MDETSKRILTEIQKEFPLAHEPFRILGEKSGISQEACLERIRELKGEGLIREIAPVFNSKALGYQSALVAMKVHPARIEEAARRISEHSGVSHNYERLDPFNLWFTIAASSRQVLASEIEKLEALSGALKTMVLPEVKVFKIGVKFDLLSACGGHEEAVSVPDARNGEGIPGFNKEDILFVKVFQEGIPVLEKPFEILSLQCGISEKGFFSKTDEWLNRGLIRRVSAALNHRKTGFSANALVAWNIPEERREAAGRKIARFSRVSHCYERAVPPEWPYPVFSMIHGTDEADLDRILCRVIDQTGDFDRKVLRTGREFKKAKLKFFASL